ncbi:Leguminosin secreted peptide [Quillaja saponaria]|uniref:Leguminosin secreted peptide n=1 Tax=Quillaja saponaria TaxID=32244 RepID=A0AAD7QDZ3_QUISA|nr:Leguminosin secreted peptide [Quillaja saponaria]
MTTLSSCYSPTNSTSGAIAKFKSNDFVQSSVSMHSYLSDVVKVPVIIECQVSEMYFELWQGEDYDFNVDAEQVETCRASCNGYAAGFRAYDPDVDKGHDPIYWKVETLGLSLSLDNKT